MKLELIYVQCIVTPFSKRKGVNVPTYDSMSMVDLIDANMSEEYVLMGRVTAVDIAQTSSEITIKKKM